MVVSAADVANGWLLLDTFGLLALSFRMSWSRIYDLSGLTEGQLARQRRTLPVYRMTMYGAFLTMLVGMVHVVCRNLVGTGPAITYGTLGYAALVLLGLAWVIVAKPDREE